MKKNTLKKRSKSLGQAGEERAVKFLKKNKYRILEINFQSKYGEIDIIAMDDKTLVFVEVKTRVSKEFGPPEKAITPWKIRRMTKTAQYFLTLHPEIRSPIRLDAVAIKMLSDGEHKIKLIKNITL